jgi:hypothetical protein
LPEEITGAGNIYGSVPPFILLRNNYGLRPGSPCIDVGNNSAVPAGVSQDIDGRSRFVDDPDSIDSGMGIAPIVDMGAHEFDPLVAAKADLDLNLDGRIDLRDYAVFQYSYEASGGP